MSSAAEILRNDGIQRVQKTAGKSPEYHKWRTDAEILIMNTIRKNGSVCSDEVTHLLPVPDGVHPSTWSAVFGGLSKRGLITQIGQRKSTKPNSHAMLVRVWGFKSDKNIVSRLRTHAEIRRQAPNRKSVQAGERDRLSDLLEEAAIVIESLRRGAR